MNFTNKEKVLDEIAKIVFDNKLELGEVVQAIVDYQYSMDNWNN
jgi:hypothetical protein